MVDGYVDIHGARLYFEYDGEGDPLILVHAGIADCRMWDDQFAIFAQQYSVVRYDMRGFGKSVLPAGEFSHAADLQKLAQVLFGEEPIHFIGVSMGAATVLQMALDQPELARSLILVAPGASGSTPDEDIKKMWAQVDALAEQGDVAGAVELEVQMWVDGPQRSPDRVDQTIREKVREMNTLVMQNDIASAGSATAIKPERPSLTRLDEVKVPTLVIIGDLDMPLIQQNAERIAAGVQDAQKVVMTGTAHVPNMEQPEWFNQSVLEFLQTR